MIKPVSSVKRPVNKIARPIKRVIKLSIPPNIKEKIVIVPFLFTFLKTRAKIKDKSGAKKTNFMPGIGKKVDKKYKRKPATTKTAAIIPNNAVSLVLNCKSSPLNSKKYINAFLFVIYNKKAHIGYFPPLRGNYNAYMCRLFLYLYNLI